MEPGAPLALSVTLSDSRSVCHARALSLCLSHSLCLSLTNRSTCRLPLPLPKTGEQVKLGTCCRADKQERITQSRVRNLQLSYYKLDSARVAERTRRTSRTG
jgi:hypothetical protein